MKVAMESAIKNNNLGLVEHFMNYRHLVPNGLGCGCCKVAVEYRGSAVVELLLNKFDLSQYELVTSVPGPRNTPGDATKPSFGHVKSPPCGFVSSWSINKYSLTISPQKSKLK
jgi:hypothetical protein